MQDESVPCTANKEVPAKTHLDEKSQATAVTLRNSSDCRKSPGHNESIPRTEGEEVRAKPHLHGDSTGEQASLSKSTAAILTPRV